MLVEIFGTCFSPTQRFCWQFNVKPIRYPEDKRENDCPDKRINAHDIQDDVANKETKKEDIHHPRSIKHVEAI